MDVVSEFRPFDIAPNYKCTWVHYGFDLVVARMDVKKAVRVSSAARRPQMFWTAIRQLEAL